MDGITRARRGWRGLSRRGAAWAAAGVLAGGGLVGWGAAVAAPATAATLPANCSQLDATTVTCLFTYTGGAQLFTVPDGVTSITATAYGATGGGAGLQSGGGGGEAQAALAVSPGDPIEVLAGGGGGAGDVSGSTVGGAAGFNSGGAGGAGAQGSNVTGAGGGGGGGASDVRTGSCASTMSCGLSARVLVGGGGGGAAASALGSSPETAQGGYGGFPTGATGGDGTEVGVTATPASGGGGGTPTSAGAGGAGDQSTGCVFPALAGTDGGTTTQDAGGAGGPGTPQQGANGVNGGSGGGGGGGGYFGGGGGGGSCAVDYAAGGGGGSSYGPSSATFTNGYWPFGNGEVTISYTIPTSSATTTTVSVPGAWPTGTAMPASAISATLSGAVAGAGGDILFTVFGPQASAPTDCTIGGTIAGEAPVNGNGTYDSSAAFTPATAGTYWWYASYTGDPDDPASASACGAGMTSTVVTTVTPTTTVSAPATDTPGTAIAASAITATLSGAATGVGGFLTFTVFGPQPSPPADCTTGGTSIGAAITQGNGGYHPPIGFTPSAAGTYWWYANYEGDPSDLPSNSGCGAGMTSTVVASPVAATTTTVSAPGTGTSGTAIAASAIGATLSGANAGATGTMTFTVFGPQSSAPSDCTTGGTTVGTATVSGNGTYNPSAGFTPSAAGTYWWYASYGGDSGNAASNSGCGPGMTSTVVQPVVLATTTTTVSAPAADTENAPIAASAISATLLGANVGATGTITFTVFGPQSSAPSDCTAGGTTVGTATVSGNGSYSPSAGFTPSAAGTYWWYASYGGDTGDQPSNSGCGSGMTHTVVSSRATVVTRTTVTAPTAGMAGTQIAPSAITATLSGAASGATGTITFTVFGPRSSAPASCTSGGTTVGIAAVTGTGSYHPPAGFTPPAAGTYWWYASYSGDASDQPSNTGCGTHMTRTVVSHAVAATTTRVVSSENPSRPGQAVTYTATVSPANGGGSVTFDDGGRPISRCAGQSLNHSGKATCTVVYTAAGSHTITAVYSGASGYAGSTSAPLTQTVVPAGADLEIGLRASSQAPRGSTVTETVTVTNLGPLTASNVATVLTEPAGLTITNADGASVRGQVLTWTAASLARGAQLTYTVTARVDTRDYGTVRVSASVRSATPDPNQGNNVASANVTITRKRR